MKSAVFLCLCLAGSVSAIEIEHGYTVTLTAEEAASCEEEGGRVFISKAKALELIKKEAKRQAGDCMGAT